MSGMIELKESLKRVYAKYDAYINPILKFLMATFLFASINSKLGYMHKIDNIVIVLILALLCSFLPMQFMSIITGLFVLLHLYSLSLECAIVTGVLFFLMFLLYVRFAPKETMVVLLTPVLFLLKVPYVMPVAMGLIGGPASIVSVTFGVVISYLLEYITLNATTLTSLEDGNMVSRIRFLVDGLLGNKSMFVMIIAFAITLLLVYTIRRRSINYAWTVAVISGTVSNIVILLISELVFSLNYSVVGLILGSILGALICMVLQFFNFHLDYGKVENLQFEDDDYYYYVRAVPKVAVSAPNKKVKKISPNRSASDSQYGGSSRTVRTANGASRTIKR